MWSLTMRLWSNRSFGSGLQFVGDQSEYVSQFAQVLQPRLTVAAAAIKASKHYKSFCTKLAEYEAPEVLVMPLRAC